MSKSNLFYIFSPSIFLYFLSVDMPEWRELLVHCIMALYIKNTLLIPTGSTVKNLWFDRDEGKNEPADFRSGCGWVGELKPDATRDLPFRQKSCLWPVHLSLAEVRTLQLEEVEWNHRRLFFKFMGLKDSKASPTWLGVSGYLLVFSYGQLTGHH